MTFDPSRILTRVAESNRGVRLDIRVSGTYGAAFSLDGDHRYLLWRGLGGGLLAPARGAVVFVGLNPSTADHQEDDPTIRRCIGFARAWNCSWLVMLNLFSIRSTDPAGIATAHDPIGRHNDQVIAAAVADAAVVVAAWGAHPAAAARAGVVLPMLGAVQCLGRTKGGHPRHPLYVPAVTPLEVYPCPA